MSKLEMNASGLELYMGAADKDSAGQCVAPARGPNSEYFPNVVVETHDGQKALFYDDLLRDKTVLISSVSIGDKDCAVVKNLLKVQELLGHRLGTEVFIYSITTDPAHDRVEMLRRFAELHG